MVLTVRKSLACFTIHTELDIKAQSTCCKWLILKVISKESLGTECALHYRFCYVVLALSGVSSL